MENNFNRREHWEQIYQAKQPHELSWYQATPEISLALIMEMKLPLSAKIIDVGGGDSLLVDYLLDAGFQNISVLDISAAAIEKAKLRLGVRAGLVKWIVADITAFIPEEKYDLLHDRAAFHFLTEEHEISAYVKTVTTSLNNKGILVIGTFSEQGPKKCSGIEIKQYSETGLLDLFQSSFEKIKCFSADHHTPFDTVQNFIFCSFRKMGEE